MRSAADEAMDDPDARLCVEIARTLIATIRQGLREGTEVTVLVRQRSGAESHFLSIDSTGDYFAAVAQAAETLTEMERG